MLGKTNSRFLFHSDWSLFRHLIGTGYLIMIEGANCVEKQYLYIQWDRIFSMISKVLGSMITIVKP